MADAPTWTLGRLLEWTTDFLSQHGADTPRLDAEVLLAEARACRRIDLYTSWDLEADEPVRTAFRELVRRRSEGTPVAYLVGRREFYSLDFRVNDDVLIPRPETEHLVIAVLDLIKRHYAGRERVRAADVGTGSGCVAIAAAKHCRALDVKALDISVAALRIAESNALSHDVVDRVHLLESDLLSALPAEPQFEIVVSNPPYITTAEMDALPRDVREFEPRTALEAGPQGTEVIVRLIDEAHARLTPGGWLLLEISPQLEQPVRALLAAHGGYVEVVTIKDLAKLVRVVQARKAD